MVNDLDSLGQFNAASIQVCSILINKSTALNKLLSQLTFSLFVYPCLVLAYLGQGARLIADGDAVMSNIFYQTIPGETNGPLYWIMFVFAILATVCVHLIWPLGHSILIRIHLSSDHCVTSFDYSYVFIGPTDCQS